MGLSGGVVEVEGVSETKVVAEEESSLVISCERGEVKRLIRGVDVEETMMAARKDSSQWRARD